MNKKVTVFTSYCGDTYEKVETARTTAYHRLQMRPGYVKPVAERFTCECGFSWEKGRSGIHDCKPHYRAKIAALTAQLTSAKEEIGQWKTNEQKQMERAVAAESLLSAERKETERLRGGVMSPGPFSYSQERRIKALIEEALKPRQWQLCPKCRGLGTIPTPSYSSSSTTTCDVCKGAKVLATPEAQ